jgi:hypothetical protein
MSSTSICAVVVWSKCSITHINKIQVIQSKILRIIQNVPWFVRNKVTHTDFDISTIKNYIKDLKDLSIKFFSHLHNPSGPYQRDRPNDVSNYASISSLYSLLFNLFWKYRITNLCIVKMYYCNL